MEDIGITSNWSFPDFQVGAMWNPSPDKVQGEAEKMDKFSLDKQI
jgi:hypothetical protein